jgi:hypothetical protein
MATNEKGILGGFSGKVGTVVGFNLNGADYMRGTQISFGNPRTEKQKQQRAKVAMIINLLGPLKNFLRVGFRKQAVRMSAFNAATSYNMIHAVTGIYPDFAIDYSKVLVSQGKLPGALNPVISSPEKGQVQFTWQDNSSKSGAMPNDRAVVVVVLPEKRKAFTLTEGSTRMVGSQTVTLPEDFNEGEVQCYLSFQNTSQTAISDSLWAGGMVVK